MMVVVVTRFGVRGGNAADKGQREDRQKNETLHVEFPFKDVGSSLAGRASARNADALEGLGAGRRRGDGLHVLMTVVIVVHGLHLLQLVGSQDG